MHIACVVGARPNFMKVAPLLRAMQAYPEIRKTLIHTGQHYDANLSDVFFDELGIRKPDISLGVGSGSHAQQTADVMVAIEHAISEQSESERSLKLMRPFSSFPPVQKLFAADFTTHREIHHGKT